MVWSWTEDASGWIIPSLNVHTHPHQASTWVGPHSEYFAGKKKTKKNEASGLGIDGF